MARPKPVASADAAGVVYGEGGSVRVETWTYSFGPRAFLRRLEFVGGKLVKISTGAMGFGRRARLG